MAYLSAMTIRSHGGLWLKMQARGPPASLLCRPGIMMLGAEKEKESNVTFKKETRVSCINVIAYLQEIIRIHMSVETHTYRQYNSPYGTLMDGWRKTEDRIVESQSRVISECYVQASRPGLDQVLCRHHRAQVEGVKGPMGKVPQLVARKGGMPAPRTHLQHPVDSEVLLEKKRRSDTTCLTSSRGRNRLFRTRKLVSTRYRLPEPAGDSGLRYLLLTNNHSQRGQCAAVRSR